MNLIMLSIPNNEHIWRDNISMTKAFQQFLYLCKHPTLDIPIHEGGTKYNIPLH